MGGGITVKTAFFVAALLGVAGTAEAEQLLFDAAPTATGSINNVCDGGVTVAIEVSRTTVIGRVKQQLQVTTAGSQVRFAIWSGAALAFYSLNVPTPQGVQIVESPDFTFTLSPGIRYHIGAITDGCAHFSIDTTGATANGIQSFAQNGRPTNFGTPMGPNQTGTADPRVLLFAPTTDVDGDGFGNAADNCPYAWQATQADADGDGLGDTCDTLNNNDVDGDGVLNVNDNCPFDANATQVDGDGDGLGDACDSSNGNDLDGDGVSNTTDNCPFKPNTNQLDTDGDGIGDLCDPAQNGVNTDIDSDGIPNADDNCAFDVNSAQLDKDMDGLGDVCDPSDERDLDDDGVPNIGDNCPFEENGDQKDIDDDGLGDACDETNGNDLDGDQIENRVDNCPFDANANQSDDDGDGFGDVCDQFEDDTGCCGVGGKPNGLLVGFVLLVLLRPRARRSAA